MKRCWVLFLGHQHFYTILCHHAEILWIRQVGPKLTKSLSDDSGNPYGPCWKNPQCQILNLFISTQRLCLSAALKAYQFSAFVHFHTTKQHWRVNAMWHLHGDQALWCQKKHGRWASVWSASSPIYTDTGSPQMLLWYWLCNFSTFLCRRGGRGLRKLV